MDTECLYYIAGIDQYWRKSKQGVGEEGGVNVEGTAVPVAAVGSLKALGQVLSAIALAYPFQPLKRMSQSIDSQSVST